MFDVRRRLSEGSPVRLAAPPLVILLVIAAALAISSCGGKNTAATTWESPNQNLRNTRYAGGRIHSGTVKSLDVAWSAKLDAKGAFGAMATQPLIDKTRVYVQDLESNVTAYDMVSGDQVWTKKFDEENVGPNGLALSDGKIYGASTTTAFALDAESGAVKWTNDGLTKGMKRGGIGFTIAPQVVGGVVHISTAAMVGGGIAYGLDADTGRKLWSFNTVPDKVAKKVGGAGVGGAWNAPLADKESVFWGIGNPYTSIKAGIENPSEGLYLDSLVRLGAADGALDWYFQAVPNDFYDWDLHLSPIAAQIEDRDVIVTGGKMGYVYAIDRKDGKLIWKRAVGKHNGHDEDSKKALEGDFKPDTPYTVWPGTLGGVETNMALADDTVYAAVVNLSYTHKDISSTDVFEGLQSYDEGDGQLVALDLESGEVKWDTKLPSLPFGAATVVNDLVFTTTYEGKIYALDRNSGDIVWQDDLPAGANSAIAVNGDTIIVPCGVGGGKKRPATLVAYRIGGPEAGAAPVEEVAPATEPEQAAPAEEQPAEEAPAEEAPAEEAAIDGKALFTANCAGCHVLADAGAAGAVGPNLDESQPPVKLIVDRVTNGKGGMPAFKDSLSEEEIEAIADYVFSVAGK